MFLTKEELEQLTGRKQTAAQQRALRFMGVDHRLRPDGSIAVLKEHVQMIFGGAKPEHQTGKRIEPNWAAIK